MTTISNNYFIIEIRYLVGMRELFGIFPSTSEALLFFERLKRIPGSTVIGYEIKPITKIED